MKLASILSTHQQSRLAKAKNLAPKVFASAVVLAGFATQNASAAFVWDLRVTAKNALPLAGGDTAKAVNVLPGDVLEITMFAQVTGTAAGLEGFLSGIGKTITTHSGVTGHQGLPTYTAAFLPPGNLPAIADLNGDGFFDLGITATSATTTTNNWFPRSITSPTQNTTGTAITNGQEFNLFQFTYTVVGAASGTASIQFTQQLVSGVINSATFQVDGAAITSKNIGLPATVNATTLGSAIVISAVPEPSAFGMLAVGALGLVGFRRMGLRRTA